VRRRKLTTPIMMLSARGVTEDRVRGLDSGADDYLTKPFDFAELIARVRALLRRQLPAASMAISIGDLRLDPVARLVYCGSRKVDLTQKEFALLEYFMRNADQVLTRAMIGEQVWDFTWDRMTNVIDVYVNHLRRKLEDAGEARVIHAVRGVGYVLRSSEHGDDQDA
jgi:DNA-binding response OmpR family regulator